MKEASTSPVPITLTDKKLLNFNQAISEIVLKNKKITKKEWNDKNIYGFLEKELLCLHKKDGKVFQWILSKADLEGTDYEVI